MCPKPQPGCRFGGRAHPEHHRHGTGMRLTPKAIEQGCATAADNVVFREFLQLPGAVGRPTSAPGSVRNAWRT
jgi:hypothetical protein